jgi:hypothetical protein
MAAIGALLLQKMNQKILGAFALILFHGFPVFNVNADPSESDGKCRVFAVAFLRVIGELCCYSAPM